ncbi:hypothetical protein FMO003_35050 [Moritella sp. F3]|nr:hypothetical protein FMO001_19740 [Moritella sp. F1]GIC83225.1 hypothetical protein FMO003_35050 [Moritella sp. F3]
MNVDIETNINPKIFKLLFLENRYEPINKQDTENTEGWKSYENELHQPIVVKINSFGFKEIIAIAINKSFSPLFLTKHFKPKKNATGNNATFKRFAI